MDIKDAVFRFLIKVSSTCIPDPDVSTALTSCITTQREGVYFVFRLHVEVMYSDDFNSLKGPTGFQLLLRQKSFFPAVTIRQRTLLY